MPNLPTQAWFPQATQMCVEPPITSNNFPNPNAAGITLVVEQVGLSPDTIDILMAYWGKWTGKQYATYLSWWVTYCKNKQVDVSHVTINDDLAGFFLTILYRQGVGYSAINTAQFALSSAIAPNRTLGTRLKKLLNFGHLCRDTPLYGTMHLRSLSALNDLTLKQLTLNLTMLLARVTAQRTQTFSKLDTSCMQETTTGITFTIRDNLKTTRPGKPLAPLEILSVASVAYNKHYITKTHFTITAEILARSLAKFYYH